MAFFIVLAVPATDRVMSDAIGLNGLHRWMVVGSVNACLFA